MTDLQQCLIAQDTLVKFNFQNKKNLYIINTLSDKAFNFKHP